MRAVDVIADKRDGKVLTSEQIEYFVQAFVRGDIADYQASAFAMAVYIRGMDEAETRALTMAMANSGKVLDLSGIASRVVDKHSSGGVGDKTTLVIGPIIAALGLPFGKMSGRGLGFSGGTLDKLESIPGFRADLTIEEFISQLKHVGIVVSGQTHELAPADGKLYALRDVTATVSSLPLIASSIMSKKIAAGAQVILLDVKVGLGAFMKTDEEATELAELMVRIGKGVGRKVGAVISDMNQPLGNAVGNSLEVIEAIETLKGKGPTDFTEHCIAVSTQLLLLAEPSRDDQSARQRVRSVVADGSALKTFGKWIQAQGGSARLLQDYAVLPRAAIVREVVSPYDGFVASINAEEIALAVVDLGGGRAKKGDSIDASVGVVLKTKIGARVAAGDPLFVLHAANDAKATAARDRMLSAFAFSQTEPQPPPLLHRIIK